MEIGLHPEALNKLLTFFLDENEEKKAQLIFTSQSLGILNRLDMQQVFLVEKDNKGSSSLKRLKTRPDENFLNKYLSGSYGAYPKIKI
jgi:predicted ATPase